MIKTDKTNRFIEEKHIFIVTLFEQCLQQSRQSDLPTATEADGGRGKVEQKEEKKRQSCSMKKNLESI